MSRGCPASPRERLRDRRWRSGSRAPVDDVLAAVDQALLVEAHEDVADGARKALVEREALARPVAARRRGGSSVADGAAGLRLPLPDALYEFFAAEVAAADAFGRELALNNHLGGDARVVGSWKPQSVIAEHAVPADDDVISV